MIIKIIIAAIIGYLLGSMNLSIILGKIYGIDIRTKGSKNAGMTNTLRVLGKKAAVITLLGDISKGVIACIIGNMIFDEKGLLIAGLLAIIGHNWPVYFGFSGGKGVLTSFSVIIMMDYNLAIALLIIFLVIVLISRYISLGSIVSAAFLPILAVSGLLGSKSMDFIIVSVLFAILVIFRHNANIKRLLNGTESKFGRKEEQKN